MPFYQPPHQPTFASVFRSFAQDPEQLQQALPQALVERLAAEEGVHFGEEPNALYTPPVTLWAFLTQCLSDTKSCVAAVARVMVLCISLARGPCAAGSGAFCKARAKLPERFLRRLTYHVGDRLEDQAEAAWLWRGRHVQLIDGATLSAPDTPANQAAYPQSTAQAPGLGFPALRLVVLLTFATAALVGAAFGPCQGKETGETALLRTLLDRFDAGDIAVADRYQCSYWQIALLRERVVDVAFRLHQRRRCDFRRGQRLGRGDHLVRWRKPERPAWLDQESYAALPAELVMREVRVEVRAPGVRTRVLTIATSLLDARVYRRDDIADLYHRRWHVELDIRNIKQTLHMDMLSCKSPDMLAREIWVHLLGYNLVRQALAEAARARGVAPRQLSFAGGVQTLNAFRWLLQCSEGDQFAFACWALAVALGTHEVGDRAGRVEPRRVKRRQQLYPLLNRPRAEARAALLVNPE
jgi:putative transposase